MRICLVTRAGLELVTFRSQSRRFPSTPHMSTNITENMKANYYDIYTLLTRIDDKISLQMAKFPGT